MMDGNHIVSIGDCPRQGREEGEIGQSEAWLVDTSLAMRAGHGQRIVTHNQGDRGEGEAYYDTHAVSSTSLSSTIPQ